MSFNIKIGTNKTYKIPLKIDSTFKQMVNADSLQTDSAVNITTITKHTLQSSNPDKYLCNYVCGELLDNVGQKDMSVPTNSDYRFLLKTEGTYKYVEEKPFKHIEISDSYFEGLLNKDIRAKDVSAVMNKSIKATRGLIQSSGLTGDAWMAYSFPYGGLSKASVHLFYVHDFKVKPLVQGDHVKLDLLEGMVYIKQTYPDKVDHVFGYFDIEPIKIFKNKYLTVTGTNEQTFCTPVQKNSFGEITVNTLTEDSFIISFSYNAFIVSSDPYFISVDGVNLLHPRFVPKNTPILVEQSFNNEVESFTGSAINLFAGVEAKEIGQLTTFIKQDSSSNIETFSEKNISSGLFIYKEVEEGSFDTSNSTYLPLFNPQNIVKEY